jgi:tRNA threonylcarbamoyladenosine biosynthesis protein TsaB
MNPTGKLLILAIESSAARSAVALLEGDRQLVTREFPRGAGGVGAGSPAAAAEAALAEAGRKASDVGLVAVSVGPGSYTGLRIGISFAKTFAWATGAAVVGVPSLAALATTAMVPGSSFLVPGSRLVPTADAFRGQLYARAFVRNETGVSTALTEDLVLAPEDLVRRLRALPADASSGSPPPNQEPGTRNQEPQFVFFGSGAAKHRSALGAAAREAGLLLAISDEPVSPSVEAVGRLGLELFLAGKTVTAHDLVPVYLRKTEAEERAEAREGKRA